MRNRAKCKLCESVIESLDQYDYVTCKCGEIAVDGGQSYCRCMAKDWNNFLRIDDEGNVVIPKIIEKGDKEKALDELTSDAQSRGEYDKKLTRADMLDMLRQQIKSLEELPPQAMTCFVTNYDLLSLMMLLSAIFSEDERLEAS